ncbi:MAG: PAS domain S-box protein [Bacteroidia bacterium]|nr:PAS domain S-box protein [Bacteroidia bacterium]
MKINIKNNWKLKVTGVFFLTSLIVLSLFSDFFLDIAIQNTVVWYLVQTYRWFFILVSLSVILFFLLGKPYNKFKELEDSLKVSRKNYRLVVDNLKDDYFFYRHEKGKPFKYLSSSVTNVLGFSKVDFVETFRKVGASKLYDDCFDRHNQLAYNDLKQPPFEVEVKNNNGAISYLEIKEIPVKNEEGELIAIEGIARNITRYRKAENELIERENKYHTLFESANDAYLIIKDDKFIDCNQKSLDLYQSSLEDLIMHTPFHYRFSPTFQPNGRSSREMAREKIDLALSNKPQFFEWTHIKNGKEPFDTEVTLNKFSFNKEDYVLAVVRDITQRKQIEKAILEQERSYHLIFDNSPFGIFYFSNEGIISDCNEKYENILLLPRNEIIGFNLLETEYNKDFKESIKSCLQGEKNTFTGNYFINKNQSLYLNAIFTPVYSSDNQLPGGFCMIHELTDNAFLLEKSRMNEVNFREILDNSRQILYKLNIKTGNYEYISSALAQLLGFTPEEFYSMNAGEIMSLLHPDDIGKAENIIAKMVKAIPQLQTEFIIEYRIRHKKGEYRWVSDKYKVVSDESGKDSYIIGNVMDITQLKEAEEALNIYLKNTSGKGIR